MDAELGLTDGFLAMIRFVPIVLRVYELCVLGVSAERRATHAAPPAPSFGIDDFVAPTLARGIF
jgi:hypothetical protein